MEIKRYKCKYCKKIGDRKNIRLHLQEEHIKTDKMYRIEVKEGKKNSPITANCIGEVWQPV